MAQEVIVPHNREASSSNTQSKEQSFASILSSMEKQMQPRDRGNEEYSISQLPLSPKSFGKPSNSKQKPIVKHLPIFDGAFISARTLSEETEDKDVLQWLYKDEEVQQKVNNVRIPTEKYGKGFNILQKMGYTRTGPIRKRKEGISEPIQPHTQQATDKAGLGYGQVTLPEDIFSNQHQEEYENRQEQLAIETKEAFAKQQAQPNMKWQKKQSSNQQEKQNNSTSQATLTLNQNKHEPSTNQGEL